MNVLTDTHAVIWFITDDKQLSSKSYKIIKNPANRCHVSIASLWEMGIKYSLGKLELITNLKRTFQIIEESGFDLMPINTEHIAMNAQLQYHHKDPFDRMIIAQAMQEEIAIISKDQYFEEYDIKLIW